MGLGAVLRLLALTGLIAAAGGATSAAGAVGAPRALPIYRDPSYTPEERAADLVSHMTLAEKASQMVSGQSPAIRRLGVRAYGWWNESLHGVSHLQLQPTGPTSPVWDTTSYPTDLALGATWDPGLMYSQASAISDEAREIAPGNAYGLDFFAPTVNLSRDPRWGRNDETFSEDPLLTANLATQYVNGLEGRDRNGRPLRAGGGYLKAIATLKHYAANNSEFNRVDGSSNMDARTLREYYTAQFRIINQQTRPGAMMTAFNRVNGVPATADPLLTQTLARQTFGFGGYFTSDCDGVQALYAYQSWRPPGYRRPLNPTEAHAFANAAGVDLNCTSAEDPFTARNLLPAASGEGIRTSTDTYNEEDLDRSLVRLFAARMQLGEFGPVSREPWVRAARARLRPGSWVNSDANHAVTETPARLGLARSVADHAVVLLKNALTNRADGSPGKLLPLSVPRSGAFSVAVIGTLANPQKLYLGGYSSIQGPAGQANEVSPYAGIKRAIQAINPDARVDFYPGFTDGSNAAELTTVDPAAVAAAATYDAVIVFAGTDRSTAGEYYDRPDLALPGAQAQLIDQVATVNPRTIAVLDTLGEVDVSGFESHVPALLWSSYNGQLTGDALADVLLGKYDPSGHLPFSWYENQEQLPALGDYSIRPSATSLGRTYMYFRGAVSYPFGYGLSYTTFAAGGLRISSPQVAADGEVKVTFTVANTGPVWGEDLLQLYLAPPGAGNGRAPIKQLEGFQQVGLSPGQRREVSFTLRASDLGSFDPARGHFVVPPGRYGIQIAASAANGDVVLSGNLNISGSRPPTPAVITAQPQMPGDPARGIQARVMFPPGTQVLPNLTTAMNDQSLYGYGHRHLPHGALVRLRSDRADVVAVAADGTLRTRNSGVATITATVTVNGISRSGQFVIRVLSQLTGLAVDGTPVPDFHPDAFDYEMLVPSGLNTPRLSAAAPDAGARVHLVQAAGIPGRASATITGRDGISSTYHVYFARVAHPDAFSGSRPGPAWSWIRPSPAQVHQSPGTLTIVPMPGDVGAHTARNLLVEPALGDWTLQTRVSFSTAPHADSQQAGLIAYQDDENYLKLDLEYSGGAVRLAETTSDSLSGTPVSQILTSPPAAQLGGGVWLRMVKRGPRYTTYYSADGHQFVWLYNTGASLHNVDVGLFAISGADPTLDLNVVFSALRLTNSGPTIAIRRKPRPGSHRSRPAPRRSRRPRAASYPGSGAIPVPQARR